MMETGSDKSKERKKKLMGKKRKKEKETNLSNGQKEHQVSATSALLPSTVRLLAQHHHLLPDVTSAAQVRLCMTGNTSSDIKVVYD